MIDNNAGEERRKSIYKEKTSAWVKILGTFTSALIVGLGSLNLSVSGSQENKLDVILRYRNHFISQPVTENGNN